MSIIMTYKAVNIINQRRESINVSIVGRKLFILKIYLPWMLIWLTSYLFNKNFRFYIVIFCTSLLLDSPFTISWKPKLDLMEWDLWLLKMLSKILVLSWNLKCLSFSYNLLFRMFTSTSIIWYCFSFSRYFFLIPSLTFIPSSNCSFN